MRLVIASRGSALALRQAEQVRATLERDAQIRAEVRVVRTSGDRTTATPLPEIGVIGIFTREVDREVLDGRADLAVHSLKDLPTSETPGLVIGAVPEREDPRDAFVPSPGSPARLADLPRGARVGTSSLRRRALLLELRPDLDVRDLRGNLDTRLSRLAAGELDGAVLARAGIRRLGREEVIGEVLDPPHWLPAAGQGALAIVIRADDGNALAAVSALEHLPTRSEADAERAFLHELRGGCQAPVGALARRDDEMLRLDGFVAPVDGRGALRAGASRHALEATRLGRELALEMLRNGAAEILAAVRARGDAFPGASPP